MQSPNFLSVAAKLLLTPLLFLGLTVAVAAYAKEDVDIFVDGKLLGDRGLTVGDPKQWVTQVKNLQGDSESGKVKLMPSDFRKKGDAMRLTFSENAQMGQMSIYGAQTNLTEYKNSAALMFTVKVHSPPTQDVNIILDCTYPCRAQYDIGGILKNIKPNTWTAIPIPLSCFSGSNFDLSKINGVFGVSTVGGMDVSLADIRIKELPKDALFCPEAPAQPATAGGLNPDFFYFINGKIIGPRGITLGDPGKWGLLMNGPKGESATGKLKVEQETFQTKDDALHLKWSKKDTKGELGIYGPPTDLSAFKDLAALTFDVKVNSKPRESVNIGLDCGYPCRAEYEAGVLLTKLKRDTWTAFSIPLNCFKSSNFDLSKINGVFLISTSGKLDLSLANIRLEKLAAGAESCKD